MSARSLLQDFDAALPRLHTFPPRSVPAAGYDEYRKHQERVKEYRIDFGMFGAMTAITGGLTWMIWSAWIPIGVIVPMLTCVILSAGVAGMRFLQLAFGQRLEQALPSGTDAVTARLEDGTQSLIRYWNVDAFVWNQRVDALRIEVSNWQFLKDFPEERDVDWTEKGSSIQAEGLVAAIEGFAAERAALVARKEEIEHALLRLDARLRRLEAVESVPRFALPPRTPDDPDEG